MYVNERDANRIFNMCSNRNLKLNGDCLWIIDDDDDDGDDALSMIKGNKLQIVSTMLNFTWFSLLDEHFRSKTVCKCKHFIPITNEFGGAGFSENAQEYMIWRSDFILRR